MISYKRDVLERQSLSEVKMGKYVKECVKRLWNTLKTTFLNFKLQRLCKSHHSQCITSSEDSEKLEKSLCVRDKAEDLCWMPVVFGPSDNTASLIGMILSLTLLNGPRNTSRNHCWIAELACLQSWSSPIENIWGIIKQKILQRQPQTLQQLETYIRQEWDQIPTPKLQKLITSMLRRLQTVLKRRGDATPWLTCPRPNYFETCSGHQIWNELILCIEL